MTVHLINAAFHLIDAVVVEQLLILNFLYRQVLKKSSET
jgi:hypothetical protein